ncbi:LOW QUALITY PROTEIN: protein ANKUB1 [Rhynchocyon petersi]
MIKEEDKPILYVFSAVTQKTKSMMESISLLNKKVYDLRTLVTLRCGFPVYCLQTPQGLERYDCNALGDCKTLHLDDWEEILIGCLIGLKLKVQCCLSEGPVLRYQKRVALYNTAFHGHVELTGWALRQGVPQEAFSIHPYRAWCWEAFHADVYKCPIHTSAESGQLLILKAFVNCSMLCLECKNTVGQTPIMLKHRHKDPALLLNKMWPTVSFPKVAVPMRIYIKIKQWVLRTQGHLSKNQLYARVCGARVGEIVMVDGFTKPKMSSQSWRSCRSKDSQNGPPASDCHWRDKPLVRWQLHRTQEKNPSSFLHW